MYRNLSDESSAYFEAAKILFTNLNYDDKRIFNKAAEIDPDNKWYFFLSQLFRSQYDSESEAKPRKNLY